jgi:hypothetical protein
LKAAGVDGVTFGGPVPKAEVAATYARWDALAFVVTGGRYMTSGKVYEFMATGLPIVSAHEAEHDAATVLADYPLWAGPATVEATGIAESFRRAARLAVDTSDADRAAARRSADRYARETQLEPAVRAVTELVR